MKIFNFGKEAGKEIQAFNSNNLIMTKILNQTDEIQIGYMHIDKNGVVGKHQAITPQLLLVVSGEGIVIGKEDKEYVIKAGYAAYWEEGEWHETKTETGLSAIVFESRSLDLRGGLFVI